MGGTYTQIATVGTDVTSFQNSGLMAGLRYFYRIRSSNGGGDSSYSNEADATTSGTYVPGVAAWKGFLYNNDIAARGSNLLYNGLTNAGYADLLYGDGACTTNPAQPTWWAGAAVYTQVNGTRQCYDWSGLYWNGANRQALFGDGDGRGGGVKITIIPNVTSTTQTKMALILSDAQFGPATYTLNTIKIGEDTTTFNQALSVGPNNATVGEVNLTFSQNQAIEITVTYTGVPWSGMSLAFLHEPGLPPIPASPTNLTATAISSTQINLTWTDTDPNATGFKIERKIGLDGTYSQIAAVGAGANQYANIDLASQTRYFFRVRASGITGSSDYSNEADATTTGGTTYAEWLTANSPATGFATDTDDDGVANGIEHILGSDPNKFTAGLTQISATATSVTFQHTLNPTLASDVTYGYQWSSDLTEWKASGVANTGGTIANIVPSAPIAGVVTVVTTIADGPAGRLFVRLVAGNP